MTSTTPKISLNRSKRVLINDGPDFIEFSPGDVGFAERFYAVYRDFEAKQAEYERKSKELDSHMSELDANGLPANLPEGLAFLREACEYLRGRIDYLFGEGTSQKLFGDVLSLELIGQFFDGITPFVQAARSEKLAAYANRQMAGRVMR